MRSVRGSPSPGAAQPGAGAGKDRAKTNVNGFSQLGLVEMTRKRTRESLEHVLCAECPQCKGRGRVKTVESVCFEILREIIGSTAPTTRSVHRLCGPSVADSCGGGVPQSGGAGSLHRQAGQGGLRAALWAGKQFDVVMM